MAERSLPTGRPHLAKAAAMLGHEVFVSHFVPGSEAPQDDLPTWGDRPVVYFGPHQGIRQVLEARPGWDPGAYVSNANHAYSGFAPELGGLMMNDGFSLVTVADLLAAAPGFYSGLFARPDNATKGFPGTVLGERSLEPGEPTRLRAEAMSPSDLVVLAPTRRILGEARFAIVANEVVAWSTYRWSGKLDVRSDVHPACMEVALEVAGREWQADGAYACDVALVEGATGVEARLLELNALSSSGLYACDTLAVVRAVADLAAARPAPSPEP
jgi:hypothetical protein